MFTNARAFLRVRRTSERGIPILKVVTVAAVHMDNRRSTKSYKVLFFFSRTP